MGSEEVLNEEALKKEFDKLPLGATFEVRCKNRRALENQGNPKASSFPYFTEFVELISTFFPAANFSGKRPGSAEFSPTMTELDETFLAQGEKGADSKARVLVLADSDAELHPLLQEVERLGFHPEGASPCPFQEIASVGTFRVHHLRGPAQILFVAKVFHPTFILATGNSKAALEGRPRVIESIEDLKHHADKVARKPESASRKIGVVWEGTFFAHHSLSRVNEEITLNLNKEKISLSLLPYEPPQFLNQLERRLSILPTYLHRLPEKVDFQIRHQWPPHWDLPPEGALILMQPWEFGSLPKSWVENAGRVREIWAYTHYVRDTYVRSGVPEEQVRVIPLGIDPEIYSPLGPKLDLKTRNKFRFLYVGGTIGRKGFDILIKAYLQEFKAEEDVCLVIRDFYYKSEWRAEVERLSKKTDVPEICLYTDSLLPNQLPSLYRACHAYVQPYRGEGFGLPVLEAMACGLPTIVTGYGAALDFCHPANAYLLPAKLVLCEAKAIDNMETVDHPFWAEADLDALRKTLRKIFTQQRAATHTGILAAQEVLSQWTWRASARAVEERLETLLGEKERSFSPGFPASTSDFVNQYNLSPPDFSSFGTTKPSWKAWNAHQLLERFTDNAERAFLELQELSGWEGEAYYGLAKIALLKNTPQKALEFLENAVEACPYHTLAWAELASLAQKLGDPEKASLAALEAGKIF